MSFKDNFLLKKKLKGELHSDEIHRYLLSTDGSIYKVVPEAIVYPKDASDIITVLEFCKNNQITIHPRGSGSGICGAALGNGYVLDFTKFMNKILKVDLNERYIVCEAGVKGGEIKEALKNTGLFFPVDPSSFDYASVSGMYNTNASGSHSIAYGNFNDYVLDAEILFSTGKLLWLSEIEKKSYKDLDVEFKQIFDLYNANKSDIASAYPNLRCNVSGYNLRKLVVNNRLKLINLFAGSEGTLGIVTKLKLKLIDKPKYNILIVAYFDDINKSVNAVNIIQSKNPSAIEIMDKSLLGLAVEKNKSLEKYIPLDIDNVLLIEFDGNNINKLEKEARDIIDIIKKEKLTRKIYLSINDDEKEEFWAIRKAAAPMLYKLRGDEKTTHLIESAAIPVSQLVNYFKLMYNILNKYKLRFAIVGHIGKGVVHTEPRLNLKNKKDVELLKILSDEASDLVISLGGTIAGEHGEGLNRSYYIKKQYPTIYKLFVEVKKILEPYNLLNPYIKTYFDETQVKECLRYGEDYIEHNIVKNLNLNWSYKDFVAEVDMCNGCSNCTIPSAIFRMCPVYKFDFDEFSTPKSKANILRGLISGELNSEVMESSLFKTIMERCINCGACTVECPSNVNIPKLAIEAKATYYKSNRVPVFYKLSSNLDYAKKLTPLLARINNYFISLELTSNLLSNIINISSDIKKIRLAENNLFKRYNNHSNIRDKKVLLFAGCYYNFVEPDISIKTINILEKYGFQVILPDQFCCGIPAASKGLVDLAKKKIIKNIEKWGDIVHNVQYIISACSSCTYALKNLWKSIIDDEIIYEISRKTKLTSEVLIDIELENKYNDKEKRRALYHEPCHLRFQSGKNSTLELLKKLEYLEVQSLDSNCCGMAGSWGMYNKNAPISQKIGDDLKNRINKKGRDGYYLLLTDCPSCRMRLKDISKKPVLHPVELINS